LKSAFIWNGQSVHEPAAALIAEQDFWQKLYLYSRVTSSSFFSLFQEISPVYSHTDFNKPRFHEEMVRVYPGVCLCAGHVIRRVRRTLEASGADGLILDVCWLDDSNWSADGFHQPLAKQTGDVMCGEVLAERDS
jgi:hypothetical protein